MYEGTLKLRFLGMILALCVCYAGKAAAQAYYSQYPFTYTTDGTSATIEQTANVSGTLTVPSTLGGLPVKTIAANAFNSISATTISIPASVTSLSGSAFRGCRSLTSITVSSTNPNFSSSSGVLYNKSKSALLKRPAGLSGSPTFLTSVTQIGSHAFQDNGFTSVTLPDRITSVGSGVFQDCGLLTQVVFPVNLDWLGSYFFKNCRSLQTITLPPKLESIPSDCFYNCDALERIVIPPLVTVIGVDAFRDCQNLREVVIPAATVIIPPNSFWDSPNLVSFEVHPDNPANSSEDGVLFNKDKTVLELYPAGRAGSYVIPETVVTMENLAFKGATKLSGVQLSPGLTKIPIYAFTGCKELRWIEIPAGVDSIGLSAFFGCEKLERAVFQGNAPAMGTSVFNSTAAGFAVYFFEGASGFTAPVWQGYPAASMGARTEAKEWLLSHELPHDSDLDQEISGLELLMAYALDLDPRAGEVAALPRAVVTAGRMEMEFPAPRAELTYRVETSEDLLRWGDEGVTTVPLPGGLLRHASAGMFGNARFMRLVIEQ